MVEIAGGNGGSVFEVDYISNRRIHVAALTALELLVFP